MARKRKSRWRKSPYARIVDASNRGAGVRLSADECARMATLDPAIFVVGIRDLYDEEDEDGDSFDVVDDVAARLKGEE
jgi:hypothetical protein